MGIASRNRQTMLELNTDLMCERDCFLNTLLIYCLTLDDIQEKIGVFKAGNVNERNR